MYLRILNSQGTYSFGGCNLCNFSKASTLRGISQCLCQLKKLREQYQQFDIPLFVNTDPVS